MEKTLDSLRRIDFITNRHGLLNVLHVMGAHILLIGIFFILSRQMPFVWGILPALIASWVHQRFLSEMVHEASHYNFIPSKKWNDILANWLCSFWHGYYIKDYRRMHFHHHASEVFFIEKDPDTNKLGIRSKKDLIYGLLKDLSGYSAVSAYVQNALLPQTQKQDKVEKSFIDTINKLIPIAFLHTAFLVLSFIYGIAGFYLLYMFCLVTLYSVMNRIRVYGQHLGYATDGHITTDGTTAARTIDAGFFDRLFFTSRLMMYHYEHHKRPNLPYRGLQRAATKRDDKNTYLESRWELLKDFYKGLPKS